MAGRYRSATGVLLTMHVSMQMIGYSDTAGIPRASWLIHRVCVDVAGVHNLLDPTSPSTSLVGPGWISPRRLDFPRPRFAAFFKGGPLAAKPRPLRHTAAPLIGAPFRLAWTCPTEKRDGLLLISFQEQALGSFGREVALVVCLA